MPNYIKVMMRKMKTCERYDADHPSIRDPLISSESKKDKEFKSGSQKRWKNIDESYIKPWLIFDYLNRKSDIAKEKQKLKMNSEGFDAAGFLKEKRESEDLLRIEDEEKAQHIEASSASNQDDEEEEVIDKPAELSIEDRKGSKNDNGTHPPKTGPEAFKSINQDSGIGVTASLSESQ